MCYEFVAQEWKNMDDVLDAVIGALALRSLFDAYVYGLFRIIGRYCDQGGQTRSKYKRPEDGCLSF